MEEPEGPGRVPAQGRLTGEDDLEVVLDLPEGWAVEDDGGSLLTVGGPEAGLRLGTGRFVPESEEGFDAWMDGATDDLAASNAGFEELHRGLLVVDDRPAHAAHYTTGDDPTLERLLVVVGVAPGYLLRIDGWARGGEDPLAPVRAVVDALTITGPGQPPAP